MALTQEAMDHYQSLFDSAESDKEREELFAGLEQHHAQDNYLITNKDDLRLIGQQALGRVQPEQSSQPFLQDLSTQEGKNAAIKASGGDMITGLNRGIQNVQAMGYGATALTGKGLQAIGLEDAGQAVQDFGMKGYRRNVEEAKQYPSRHSFKDVYTGKSGFGGAIDWAQGTLGELVPSMAEAALGAAVGAAMGSSVGPEGTVGGGAVGAFAGRTLLKKAIDKGVKQVIKKGVSKEAESQIRKQVTKQALKKFGGKVGMGAAVMPMESGGMYADLLENKGIDAPETALLFGALSTAMEYAGGNSKLVDTFIDALGKGSTGLVKKSAKELLTNIPQEALQEGGQEVMSILNTVVNTDEKLLTVENLESIVESMGAGAIGGGAGALVSSSLNTQGTTQESEIDKKFKNITSLGTEKIPESIDALKQEIDKNNQILQNEKTLTALADKSGYSVDDLKGVLENKNVLNEELRTRLQTELESPSDTIKQENVAATTDKVDIETVIKQQQDKETAQQANKEKQLKAIDEKIDLVRNTYLQITDPAKREKVGKRLTALNAERKAIEEGTETKQSFQKTPTILADEKQAFYEDLFGTANLYDLSNGKNNAKASAEVLVPPQTSSFIDEQQFADANQVDNVDQVPMVDIESQLEVNNQQLDILAKQIANTTDPNERIALQQEGSVLYAENKKLQDNWDKQYQEQNQITESEANAEFQAGEQAQTNQLSLASIESMFPNQQVNQADDGTISIQFKNGKGVTFKSVQDAGQGFIKIAIETGQMSENGKILGITVGNEVLLDANYADDKTMWHENKHVLDNLGMITEADNSALNREFNKLRKAGKLKFALSTHEDSVQRMKENRANMFAQIMTDRAAYRGDSKFKAMIQRVLDFMQQLWNYGQQSIAGLARDVETGQVYSRKPNGDLSAKGQFFSLGKTYYKGGVKKEGDLPVEGFFISPEKEVAQNYANLYSDKFPESKVHKFIGNFEKIASPDKLDKVIKELGLWEDDKDTYEYIDLNHDHSTARKIIDELKSQGYDAVQFYDFLTNDQIEFDSPAIMVIDPHKLVPQTTISQAEVMAKQWYSQVAKAIDSSNMQAAKAGRWYNQIKNYPNVKSDEMEWSGLTEFLKENPQRKITKQELQDWFAENQVQLEEVILSDNDAFEKMLNNALQNTDYQYKVIDDLTLFITDKNNNIIQEQDLPQEVQDKIYSIINKNKTLYGEYRTDEGSDYREFILTWPNKHTRYTGQHWTDIINPIVSVRTQVRTRPDGTKFLHIEEIQSDWDQEGQKRGFAKQVPEGFRVEETNTPQGILYKVYDTQGTSDILVGKDWTIKAALDNAGIQLDKTKIHKNPWTEKSTILAMKRMIRYAAENGIDAVAWSSSDIQTDRWGSEGFSWDKNTDGSFTLRGFSQVNPKNSSWEQDSIDNGGDPAIDRIKNKQDLHSMVDEVLSDKQVLYAPDKWNQYIDKQTDKLWKRMQESSKRQLDDLNNDKILSDIDTSEALFILDENDPLIDKIDKDINKYTKELNQKLQDTGLKQYRFILNYDGWDLVQNDSTIAKGATPQEAFNKINPSGSYFPRAEAFKEVYDKKLYSILKNEFGKNQWGKPKFSLIEQDGLKLPSMEITQRMKSKALREGMPMFNAQNDSMAAKALTGQLKKTDTNTPEFNNWFDQSVAKKADGSPIELYHGTDQVFEVFNKDGESNTSHATSALGHFFTTNKKTANKYGQHTLPVYLKMNNPYKMSLQEAQSLESVSASEQRQQELRDAGYDSVIIETGADPYIVVFDSGQVKSVYNQGEFKSPENIYFETREQEQPEQKLSDKEYEEGFREKNNLLQNIRQITKIRAHDLKLLADKSLGAISTRLANASPMLRDKMRRLDFDTSQKIIKVLRTAQPLLEKTKKMSPEERYTWDLARKEGDTAKINQLAERYDMQEDILKLREELDSIRQQAIDVGYAVGFINDYWPRIIKDTEGFLQATQGISHQPKFTNAIRDKAKKMGITVEELNRNFPDVRADIISNMILNQSAGIGGPGNIQGRVFEKIPKEYRKYYMDSDAALMQYIYSMTKKIEARKFFGKVPPKIQQHKLALAKATATRTQLKSLNEQSPETIERISELNDTIERYEGALNKYKNQRDYTENIGAYIDGLMISGELNKKDEQAVRDILNARFNEHGTTGVVNAYKNLAYIDVMGNPISALTQIGDLAWAAYVGKAWTPKGFKNTTKNLINAVLNKSNMTKEDLGLERIAQEFADGTTLGNAVSNVFKYVGLTKMDSIGKETLINNALMNYQDQIKTDQGRKDLEKQIRPTFGLETRKVIEDLATDTHSDNVKMLIYSRLLDFQPAALSEMPEYYLKGGNGRVFYMLKTYTLKQMDVFRNEIFHELKSKDPKRIKQGLQNMVGLLSMLTLANAGADELKDLVLGKEVHFEDNVIDNFLTMGGVSRYKRMQITRDGLGTAIAKQILPPFKFVNAAWSDASEKITTGEIDKGLRTVDSIPGIGKWAYWHYGRGSENKKTLYEQDFAKDKKRFTKFKKEFEKSEDRRAFLQANADEFKQMTLFNNIQKSLNGNKATINKLKKLDQTPNVIKRIGQLKNQRELFYQRYFELKDNLMN